MSIVNGFVCSSACDIAEAKAGRDPHPAATAARKALEERNKPNAALTAGEPAVTFGGVLAQVVSNNNVHAPDNNIQPASGSVQPVSNLSAANGTALQAQGQIVNILV